jgi:hypothetical protein
VTEEEIISNVLEGDNNESGQESSTPPFIRTERHDGAMNAFNTCYKWTERNNVQAEYMLTLKRLQGKVLKEALRNNRQETIDCFVETQ